MPLKLFYALKGTKTLTFHAFEFYIAGDADEMADISASIPNFRHNCTKSHADAKVLANSLARGTAQKATIP